MKTYNITVNGQTYVVNVEEVAGGAAAPAPAPIYSAVLSLPHSLLSPLGFIAESIAPRTASAILYTI